MVRSVLVTFLRANHLHFLEFGAIQDDNVVAGHIPEMAGKLGSVADNIGKAFHCVVALYGDEHEGTFVEKYNLDSTKFIKYPK